MHSRSRSHTEISTYITISWVDRYLRLDAQWSDIISTDVKIFDKDSSSITPSKDLACRNKTDVMLGQTLLNLESSWTSLSLDVDVDEGAYMIGTEFHGLFQRKIAGLDPEAAQGVREKNLGKTYGNILVHRDRSRCSTIPTLVSRTITMFRFK